MAKQKGVHSNEPKITEPQLSSSIKIESKSVPVETQLDNTSLVRKNNIDAQSDSSGSTSNSDSEYESYSSESGNNVNESSKEKKRKRKWKKKKNKSFQKPNAEKSKSKCHSSVSGVSDRILSPKKPSFVWKKKRRDSEVDSSFSSFSNFSSFSRNNTFSFSNNHSSSFSSGCYKQCSYSIQDLLSFNTGVNSESLKDRMFDSSVYQKLYQESSRFYANQCYLHSKMHDSRKGVSETNAKGPIFKWVPKTP